VDALLLHRETDALAVLGLLPGESARSHDERYVSGREASEDMDIEQQEEQVNVFKRRERGANL